MKGKRQENERKKKMKGEVGAQRRDWSSLMERLGLTEGEVGLNGGELPCTRKRGWSFTCKENERKMKGESHRGRDRTGK